MGLSVTKLAGEVRRDWRHQGLQVSAADLSKVPEALREQLPTDFRAFVTVAGLPDGEDSRLIRFWPVDEWESIDSVLAFADFLIDSHRYVLWLSGPHRGDVSLLHGSEPEPPIGSFAEFLAAYLADDPVLEAFSRSE